MDPQNPPTPDPDLSDSTVDGIILDAETREMTRARETYIGNYRIEVKIGDGGMGIVYKAADPRLKRFVALKVLKDQLAVNKSYLDRLGREAQLLASISHPAIVQVHAFEDGQDAPKDQRPLPFLVMEYFEGESLEVRLEREKKLDLNEAISLIQQACEGLEAAHANGVIHRDIKPSNLLVNSEGQLKIVDFGLAKEVDSKGTLTQEGVILGTPQYISPEQGTGEGSDYRSDLYSLGATFHHMITGKPLFKGDSHAAVIYAHVHHAPQPPHQIDSGLPPAVSSVIGRMVAKSPKDRYQSHQELVADLEALREGRALVKATESTAKKTFTPPALPSPLLNRLTWISTTVAVVSLLILLFTSIWGDSSPPNAEEEVLAPFEQIHPNSGLKLVELNFSQLASSNSKETWLERLFDWPSDGFQGSRKRPSLGANGILLKDFKAPLTLKSRLKGLKQIQLRGVLLYQHSTLGISLIHPSGGQVRTLDFALQADKETNRPVEARRHNTPLELGTVISPFPALVSRKCNIILDFVVKDKVTEVTMRIDRQNSAGFYKSTTFQLQGEDWADSLLVLRPTSYLARFTTSIEMLRIIGSDFDGMDFATPSGGQDLGRS